MRKGFFVCVLSVFCLSEAADAQDYPPLFQPSLYQEPKIDDPVTVIPKRIDEEIAHPPVDPHCVAPPIVAAPVVVAGPPIAAAAPPPPVVFWANGEYLLWMFDQAPMQVPLATNGAAGTTGVLGAPGTQVAIGNRDIDFGLFSGFRGEMGMWFSGMPNLGFELGGFFTEQRSDSFRAGPPNMTTPVVGRPIADAITNTENAALVGFPGAFTGTIDVTATARLWGFEASPALRLWTNDNITVDGLMGFRYLHLEESLHISEQTSLLGMGAASFNGMGIGPGTSLATSDNFEMRNQFFGGQMGSRIQYNLGRLGVSLIGKVALGSMRQTSLVTGSTTATGVGAAPATVAGGLLAVGSNSGRQQRDTFAVIPEVGMNLHLRVTDRISLFGGYSFLFVSDVLRPGDQIDRTVNPTLVPSAPGFGTVFGPSRPSSMFNQSDFFAHGANFGLKIVFGGRGI